MALPKAIQEQANAIAAMEQQATAAPTEPASPGTAPPTPAAPAANEAQALDPAATATPPEPAAAPPEPKADEALWEQRYRTLQGMFSRETRTLHAKVQELEEKLAAKPAAPAEPAAPATSVTPKDAEAFGEDLIDLARRIARDEFGAREATYVNRIEQLEAQLTKQVGEVRQTQQASASELFFERLTAAVPTWERMQETPECQQWLAARVPGFAFTWNDALQNAAAQLDVQRAVEIFGTFIAAHPKFAPPRAAAPAAKPQVNQELARQVTPQKTSSPAPAASSNTRVYTSAEYAAESDRVIRLSKAGKFDEAAQIEQQLNAALMEGRIRP